MEIAVAIRGKLHINASRLTLTQIISSAPWLNWSFMTQCGKIRLIMGPYGREAWSIILNIDSISASNVFTVSPRAWGAAG